MQLTQSNMIYTTHDELTGTLVLVHSDTKDYQVSNQGLIGMIIADDLKNDMIYVGFGMGEQSLYTAGELWALKRSNLVYADMMRNSTKLDTLDFKDIFRICMLLDSGLMKDRRKAIELSRYNDVIRSFAMAPLAEVFGIRQVQHLQTLSA
ncbi:hypothetical protein ACFQ3S_18080 [Mucilaginibacter terrae]|uniref:hypothetical protein n=1 Tax=Mucilaginibacter terrae TaxID=1955052 RepID=UPI003645E7E6